MAILTEYLRRRCLALQAEDRADLAGMLLQSLEGESPLDCDKALEELAALAVRHFGRDIRDERRRTQPVPDMRCAFVYLATQVLPVSQSRLARFLHIQPCTANYYTKKMAAAIETPGMNPRLVLLYKSLYEEYAKTTIHQ